MNVFDDNRIAFSGILAIACLLLSSITAASAGEMTDLRGKRYGEVLVGKGGLLIPKEFDVYNTIGLNDCPEELWSTLDSAKIKAQTGAKAAILNGPRYWTLDEMKNSKLISPDKISFGGLEMRHAGTIELSLRDKLSMGKPYAVHRVARTTTWVFKAGRPVYELIAPDKAVYLMQSYSVQKSKQDEQSLASLGSRLKLEKGWTFRTANPTHDVEVKAQNGMAYVVQDDLDNTYQKSALHPDDQI